MNLTNVITRIYRFFRPEAQIVLITEAQSFQMKMGDVLEMPRKYHTHVRVACTYGEISEFQSFGSRIRVWIGEGIYAQAIMLKASEPVEVLVSPQVLNYDMGLVNEL